MVSACTYVHASNHGVQMTTYDRGCRQGQQQTLRSTLSPLACVATEQRRHARQGTLEGARCKEQRATANVLVVVSSIVRDLVAHVHGCLRRAMAREEDPLHTDHTRQIHTLTHTMRSCGTSHTCIPSRRTLAAAWGGCRPWPLAERRTTTRGRARPQPP